MFLLLDQPLHLGTIASLPHLPFTPTQYLLSDVVLSALLHLHLRHLGFVKTTDRQMDRDQRLARKMVQDQMDGVH